MAVVSEERGRSKYIMAIFRVWQFLALYTFVAACGVVASSAVVAAPQVPNPIPVTVHNGKVYLSNYLNQRYRSDPWRAALHWRDKSRAFDHGKIAADLRFTFTPPGGKPMVRSLAMKTATLKGWNKEHIGQHPNYPTWMFEIRDDGLSMREAGTIRWREGSLSLTRTGVWQVKIRGKIHPNGKKPYEFMVGPIFQHVTSDKNAAIAKIKKLALADIRKRFPETRAGKKKYEKYRAGVVVGDDQGRRIVHVQNNVSDESEFLQVFEGSELIDSAAFQEFTCLTKGTLVAGEKRDVPVESLKVGDRVITVGLFGTGVGKVLGIRKHRAEITLSINGGIRVTPYHMFEARHERYWACNLVPGNELYRATNLKSLRREWTKREKLRKQGKRPTIISTSIEKEVVKSVKRIDQTVEVYEIDVDAPHTYLANGYVVHNKSLRQDVLNYPGWRDPWFSLMMKRCQARAMLTQYKRDLELKYKENQ